MPLRLKPTTARDLQALFRDGSMGSCTDGQLMAQSLGDGDSREAAFRALVVRHGPMVLGVCRRILDDPHAAEDAFQTTFLVLVKKAGTLRNRDLLTNWLYGVANRVARKSKVETARRRAVESCAPGTAWWEGDHDRAELAAVIDEEISRLPERFRVPLVLCHLEGMRHHEVARRLGCPVGTVESRLSRAREQLRSRLLRRGLAPMSAAIVAMLTSSDASAAPVSLVEATLRAAVRGSSGRVGSRAASAASAMSSVGRWLRRVPSLHARVAVSTLVLCAGIAALGLGADRAEGTPARRADPHMPPPTGAVAMATTRQARRDVASPPPIRRASRNPDARPSPRRSPSALATPLAGISIDGRLDDWPGDLPRYE